MDLLIFTWWLWNQNWFDRSNIGILNLQHSLHKPANSLVGLPQSRCIQSTSAGMTKDDKPFAQWCRNLWLGSDNLFHCANFWSRDQWMNSARQGKADNAGICASGSHYFQFAYFNIHTAEAYSKRVHSDLSRMLKGLRQETPCRK